MHSLRICALGWLGLVAAWTAPAPAITPDPPSGRVPQFRQAEGPPAGFEHLGGPQRTLVDVFYGGVPLGESVAVFSPGSFRFEDPDGIAARIPNLREPLLVRDALARPLEPNGDRVCERPGVPRDCGVLRPAVAGVIFDEDRFAVEVFVSPALLNVPATLEPDRLPPPNPNWTGLTTLAGTFSGASDFDTFSSLRVDSLVGRGNVHGRLLADYLDGENLRIDQGYVSADWRDWEARAGIFRTRPLRVLGESEFVGARVASSFNTQTKLYLSRARGSRLQTTLDRRSLVQIFRNGRLLASGLYDAGNVELDTAELPEGAYLVELRIQDPTTGPRTETRFFAKTTDLPPIGKTATIVEIGALRDRFDLSQTVGVTDEFYARAGMGYRSRDRLGYEGDLAWIDQSLLATVGGVLLLPRLTLQAGPVAVLPGAGGLGVQASTELNGFFASASFRSLWGETDSRRIPGDTLDFSGTTGVLWREIRFNVRGDARRRRGFDRTFWAVTPSIQYVFLRRFNLLGALRLEYTHSDRGNQFIARIELTEWLGDFNFFQSVGGGVRDGDPRRQIDLRGEWNSRDRWPVQVRHAASLRDDNDRTSLGWQGDVWSQRGSARAYVEQNWRHGESSQTFYGGWFSAGVAADGEGVEWGGENAGVSAIVVELVGAPEGARFDVIANDIRRAAVRVGRSLVLPLPPYETYAIRIASADDRYTSYDANARTATLYPGSNVRMRFEVSPVHVLLTALLRSDGRPVANARIRGAMGEAATDDSGFLQADVALGAELVASAPGEEPCRVNVPRAASDGEEFIVIDSLICH